MLQFPLSSFLLVLILPLLFFLIKKNRNYRQQLIIEQQKKNDFQIIISEYQSELSLTNNQMKIEISERKEIYEAYLQLKKELSERNTNRLNFLRNVGHEIRTPLNAINGMITLLYETNIGDDQLEYLDIARYHTKEMLNLLNDINDFSDIKRGNVKKIVNLSFSLDETLHNLHKHLNKKAQKKGIKFSYRIAENVPAILCGDPIKLRKILFNLTDNAIKFTKKGEVKIYVNLIMQNEERFTLEFQVQDSGIGIPKKIENLLFQAVFCQGDSSISRKYGGLGLGLAVAKELVNLLGGSISFNSAKDSGTTFTFTAIFDTCVCCDISKIESDDSLSKKYKTFSFSDFQILLIEENQIRVKIIKKILTQMGCQVDIALNLKDAIEKFNCTSYQAILISYSEKEIASEKWMTSIKNSNFAKIPIVALSSYLPTKNEQKQLKNRYISAWIETPVNAKELIDCIESICRSSGEELTDQCTDYNSLNEIIDKEAALSQLGDEKLFNDVFDVFMNDLPVQIKAINLALQEKDFEQISMQALSLKSSAATIMAGQIKQIAFDLGVAGNEKNLKKLQDLIKNLEQAFETLKAVNDQIINK